MVEMTDPLLIEMMDRFLKTYDLNLAQSLKVLREIEDPEYRRTLAKTDPARAKILDGHTVEERKERARLMATGAAVVNTIAFALGQK